ncbi:hypothetical protein D3Z38_18900 [Clostridiales bacterium]|nr:hypothetical protein [Clostridiales bacterium]
MFIQSEKDLESYICENVEEFKEFLGNNAFEDCYEKIEFIGRQVNVNGNFIDLLFLGINELPSEVSPFKEKSHELTFIVVELKYREVEPKDLAQISKYMNILDLFVPENLVDQEANCDFMPTRGALLGTDIRDDTREIQMCMEEERVKFATLSVKLNFNVANYSYMDEFARGVDFDDRISELKLNTK